MMSCSGPSASGAARDQADWGNARCVKVFALAPHRILQGFKRGPRFLGVKDGEAWINLYRPGEVVPARLVIAGCIVDHAGMEVAASPALPAVTPRANSVALRRTFLTYRTPTRAHQPRECFLAGLVCRAGAGQRLLRIEIVVRLVESHFEVGVDPIRSLQLTDRADSGYARRASPLYRPPRYLSKTHPAM